MWAIFQGIAGIAIRAAKYGFVEISHLALCSAILDLACGWPVEPTA